MDGKMDIEDSELSLTTSLDIKPTMDVALGRHHYRLCRLGLRHTASLIIG